MQMAESPKGGVGVEGATPAPRLAAIERQVRSAQEEEARGRRRLDVAKTAQLDAKVRGRRLSLTVVAAVEQRDKFAAAAGPTSPPGKLPAPQLRPQAGGRFRKQAAEVCRQLEGAGCVGEHWLGLASNLLGESQDHDPHLPIPRPLEAGLRVGFSRVQVLCALGGVNFEPEYRDVAAADPRLLPLVPSADAFVVDPSSAGKLAAAAGPGRWPAA